LRQSLISSRGDVTTFVNPWEHPIALSCIVLAIALMLYPVFLSYRRKRERETAKSA
jgi:TctA family transporter